MFSKWVRGNGEFFELRDLIELWFKAIMYRVFENVRKSMKFKYRDTVKHEYELLSTINDQISNDFN